jgi:hypothetical protein
MTRGIQTVETRSDMQQMLPKALIIGGLLGAAVGAAAAYLFLQRYASEDAPSFSAGDGVKIGVMVAGLLRSIAAV